MQLFRQKTAVKSFDSAAQFVSEFNLCANDFMLISRRVYEKYFAHLGLECHVEFKSKYGTSEPTDIMMDALIKDFRRSGCSRIIAIGGGGVIDMAKVLVLKDAQCTEDIFMRRVPIVKEHELIAVPTTC
ncbi:MAG: iron-containing alcohol dehydrogenase, partial [Clostridia bacterium]|nr:iron-containing alcohol dehydrogenase [Clostridia bacterium]